MSDDLGSVASDDDPPPNDVDVDRYDTPTARATINQLSVDELDAWLEQVRERRLERVKKLEAVARVKSDEVRIEAFLKYERQYKLARAALTKAEEYEKRADAAIHKLRVLAMAALLDMEV